MDMFDARVADVALLQSKPIQREVNLTESQRTEMNKLADKFNASMKVIAAKIRKTSDSKEPPKQLPPEVKQAQRELAEGVLRKLSAAQLRRLRELTLQAVGPVALTDPMVAKRVGLTDAQVKKISTMLRAALERGAALADKARRVFVADYKAKNPKTDAEKKRLSGEMNQRIAADRKRLQPTLNRLAAEANTRVNAVMSPNQRAAWAALQGKRMTAVKK